MSDNYTTAEQAADEKKERIMGMCMTLTEHMLGELERMEQQLMCHKSEEIVVNMDVLRTMNAGTDDEEPVKQENRNHLATGDAELRERLESQQRRWSRATLKNAEEREMLCTQIDDLKLTIRNQSKSLTKANNSIELLRKDSIGLASANQQLQQTLNARKAETAIAGDAIARRDQKIIELNQEIESLAKALEQERQQNNDLFNELKKANQKLHQATETRDRLEDYLEKMAIALRLPVPDAIALEQDILANVRALMAERDRNNAQVDSVPADTNSIGGGGIL